MAVMQSFALRPIPDDPANSNVAIRTAVPPWKLTFHAPFARQKVGINGHSSAQRPVVHERPLFFLGIKSASTSFQPWISYFYTSAIAVCLPQPPRFEVRLISQAILAGALQTSYDSVRVAAADRKIQPEGLGA
jgi:hypothetical protein